MKNDILFDLTNLGGTASPALSSIVNSPNIGSVGLGLRNVSGNPFIEHIEASTSYANLSDKLASLPQTPKGSPKLLPAALEWVDHDPKPSASQVFIEVQNWKLKTGRLPSGPSNVAGISTSENKWKYLDTIE
jgi:hypothetical protein